MTEEQATLTEEDIDALGEEAVQALLEQAGFSSVEELLSGHEQDVLKEQARRLNPIKFYEPNRAQEPFHHAKTASGSIPKLRLFEAGNKVGKSTAGMIEGISFSLGYKPWLPEDHPGRNTPVPVPNTGRIIAEDFPTGVQQNVMSLMKEWRPVGEMPHGEKWFKKNQAGYVAQIFFNNGSIIHLMSYDQDSEKFEGVDWDWTMYNEPPPREVFIANERGKIARSGYSWMAYTPLKEPWIHDEIVSKVDEDDNSQQFRGTIWDNWIGTKFESAHTGKVHRGMLSLEDIQEFEKRLTPSERRSRIFGEWQHLEGLIFGEFDTMRDEKTGEKIEHIVDDYIPAREVMWIEGIDPHDKKPTCMLFAFVDAEDNVWFVDQLVMEGKSVPEMADEIMQKRADLRYLKPSWTVMDVKAGGWDLAGSRSAEAIESFETQFANCGIYTIGSDSRPGTMDSSIKIVREYLRTEYNVRTKRQEPKARFMRKLAVAAETNRGLYGCIHQMKRWMWTDKGEPEKKFDDFPAIIRYMLSRRPKYRSPTRPEKVIAAYKKPATNDAGY